jgi:multidrug efflux system membrane fusion protein
MNEPLADERGAGQSRWIALAIAFGLVAWMATPLLSRGPPAPPAEPPEAEPVTVAVTSSRARAIDKRFVADGVARPDKRVTLRAEITGLVETVAAEKGARLEEGALIARFTTPDLDARLADARQEVSRTERELENARTLLERGAGTEQRVIEAEGALASARAAEAAARQALRYAEIRAPFEGVLDDLDLEVGEYVNQGAKVGALLDPDPLRVGFDVPLRDRVELAVDQAAEVTFTDGRTAEGVLAFLGIDAELTSRTFPAEVTVANPGATIASGTGARVRIETETVSAHFVREATLTLDSDGAVGVKTVDGDERVRFHPVTIERAGREGLWVSGLPETARIVTINQSFVQAGERVNAHPDARGSIARPAE